jgi:hypothetical protein
MNEYETNSSVGLKGYIPVIEIRNIHLGNVVSGVPII